MTATRRRTWTGPWADTAGTALCEAVLEVGIPDWLMLQFSESYQFISPDESTVVDAELIYSEARDQWRAKLTRRPNWRTR